jgi:uncharacterized UBP type Zn finger protein
MEQTEFCAHLEAVVEVTVGKEGVCEECIKTGDDWVHLRTCQQCGITLCCDSSPNQHATAHYQATNHPVVASAESGEQWLWCFAHEEAKDY